jgi:hypothetical protein
VGRENCWCPRSVPAAYWIAKLRASGSENPVMSRAEKSMDVSKKAYDLSARLMTGFSLPLARSFAIQYAAGTDRGHQQFSLPTSRLTEEFMKVLGDWGSRRGLMTGKACEQEGLKARQVVTLTIKNIGHADVSREGRALGYHDLLSASSGWTQRDIPVTDLRGLGSPQEDRAQEQMVLASVSGTTALFGTVLVPVEISWTDNITKNRQTLPVLQPHAAAIRADLLGAEIGSLGSACR